MNLEIGKCYRTRDGRRACYAAPSHVDDHSFVIFNGEGMFTLFKDSDLIAEWQDEPTCELGCDTVATECCGDTCKHNPCSCDDDLVSHPDQPRSKYHRIIKGVEVDIYDILVAWDVRCPARQHAIKKMFMAGQRGAKGVLQDLDEAIQSLDRAKELAK